MKRSYKNLNTPLWKQYVFSWAYYSSIYSPLLMGFTIPLTLIISLPIYLFFKINYNGVDYEGEFIYGNLLLLIILDFTLLRIIKRYKNKHLKESNEVKNKMQKCIISMTLMILLTIGLLFLSEPYL
jgi:hypothetical protein